MGDMAEVDGLRLPTAEKLVDAKGRLTELGMGEYHLLTTRDTLRRTLSRRLPLALLLGEGS